MTANALLLQQRAVGHVKLHMGVLGVSRLREAGAAKVRIPPGSRHAILINTAGGLAGGDEFQFDMVAESDAQLTVISQASERVYRTLGPMAKVTTTLKVEDNARLNWLPHETILFDGSALERNITIDLTATSRFIGLESVVLGREASGETIRSVFYRDSWTIRRDGKLLHKDIVAIDGLPPASKATLGAGRAIASLVFVAPNADSYLERVCAVVGPIGGASAWNGKLVARLVARDGLALRNVLISLLAVIVPDDELPRAWTT